jgi:hypothetical protein
VFLQDFKRAGHILQRAKKAGAFSVKIGHFASHKIEKFT